MGIRICQYATCTIRHILQLYVVIGLVSFDNFNKLCKIYQIIEKYTVCNL